MFRCYKDYTGVKDPWELNKISRKRRGASINWRKRSKPSRSTENGGFHVPFETEFPITFGNGIPTTTLSPKVPSTTSVSADSSPQLGFTSGGGNAFLIVDTTKDKRTTGETSSEKNDDSIVISESESSDTKQSFTRNTDIRKLIISIQISQSQ